MFRINQIGNRELVSAIVLASVLLILTGCLFDTPRINGNAGICFPSPNLWKIPRFPGWLINTGIIVFSVFLIGASNRKFNFISLAEPTIPILLLIALSSNCPGTFSLTTSTLLLGINVICLNFLFDSYEHPNATHHFFSIATFISVGSMFQYAFLIMIPTYFIGGLAMKSFRFRELLAFGLGLLAPYWIVLGLGIVPVSALRMPDMLKIIGPGGFDHDLMVSIVTFGIIGLLSLIFAIYNGITLMNRNSRIRCMHIAFNTLGILALLFMIVDFNNFLSYSALLYLWFAIQIANFFTLYQIKNSFVWIASFTLLFLVSYILTI